MAIAASAATGSSVTVVADGKVVSYSGGPVVGNDDPVGPPAPVCTPSGCDRHAITVKAPAGGLAASRQINLTVKLKFDDSGNTLDVGILDDDGNLVASTFALEPNGMLTAPNVKPGKYTVEVDGDIALTPQSFTVQLSADTTKRYIPPKLRRGGLSFGTPTLTDPFRLGTEPNLAIDPNGKLVYTSPIFGSSTTQSFLERSTDGGATFQTLGTPGVGKLDSCGGGGDSDVATDDYSGDVYMIDLATEPEIPARVSHNGGLSFTSDCEVNQETGPNVFTDRQWLSTDRKHHVEWYIYRDGLLAPGSGVNVGGLDADKQLYGEYLKYAPLPSAAHKAGSKQITFKSLCKNSTGTAQTCIQDVEIAGNAITDNTPSSPRYGTTYLAMETGKGITVAAFDPSSAKSVHEYVAAPDSHQILFPTVAVDRSGVVYLAWTDAITNQVTMIHNLGDLKHWTKPVAVNGRPVNITVMPWIVAGDHGRIDVAFYGTANDVNQTLNYGPW